MVLKVLTNNNTAPYVNPDGLEIRFGTSEVGPSRAGEFRTVGGRRVVILAIPDLTLLGDATAPAIIDDVVMIPKGVYVKRVTVRCTTAATGSSTTLDIGLVKRDMATEKDYNGLVVAATLANIDTIGDLVTVQDPDDSFAGALMFATTGTDSGGYYVTANYNTSAFTAGAVQVEIEYEPSNILG